MRKKNRNIFIDPDEILMDSVSALGRTPNLEGRIERPIGRLPSYLFLAFIGCGIAYLLFRAGDIGIARGESFFQQSQENRFYVRSLEAPRGTIADRFGNELVQNISSFGMVFERETFLKNGGDISLLVQQLGEITGKPREFFTAQGFPDDGDSRRLPQKIVIIDEFPLEAVVSFASRLNELPGVQLFESYRRAYRHAHAYSHLLGFVGRVSTEDIEQSPLLKHEEFVGKGGVEALYDRVLRGSNGKKIVEVDSRGREARFRMTEAPQAGAAIRLTIDGALQEFVYDTLNRFIGERHAASVIVLDVRNGAVWALMSYPSFDSNRFGHSLSPQLFDAVLKNHLRPLFNRAIAGELPPGSTIKPLLGAAALEEGIVSPTERIFDKGFIEVPNPYRPDEVSRFVDWRHNPQPRWIDLYDAIAFSANVYFYTIGGGYERQRGLGIERIKHYAQAFGLGSRLGIDIPGEKAGFIPDAEAKKILEPNDPVWRVGDTYNVSIGQGGMRVTPLQMAAITAAIANGGIVYQPYIFESRVDEKGSGVESRQPVILRRGVVSPENLRHIMEGMRRTVTAGTARLLQEVPVWVAAKTGTAQAGTNRLPHAWVTAIAPYENPEIVVVTMVEHAGEGATVAVPITNEILKWYAENRRK